jgi:hypothetical protein
MSQENMKLWRAAAEDFLARGEVDREGWVERMPQWLDPDIVWDPSELAVPDIDPIYRGIVAVQQFWREWFAAWATIDLEYQLKEAGDQVVMLLHQRMSGRSTGIEMPMIGDDGRYAMVATFRDGLMTHWKLYAKQADALEAVGLSE